MQYLSYFISEATTPLYGGDRESLKIRPFRQMSAGDTANAQVWSLNNHTGTHIDFPRHFSIDGKTINDYTPDFWFFQNVFVLKITAEPTELIDFEQNTINQIPAETDFLLIHTGFGKHRGEQMYWEQNMGLAPALAAKLREHCPKLRIVGFDFISLTSFQHRLVGREAHRKFLLESDILVVEDMNLETLPDRIDRIVCLPILVDQTDGCPVTVVAY